MLVLEVLNCVLEEMVSPASLLRCSILECLASVLGMPAFWLPRGTVTWAGTAHWSRMVQTTRGCLQPQFIHWDAVISLNILRTDDISKSTRATCFQHGQETQAEKICSIFSCLSAKGEHALDGIITSGSWLCSRFFEFGVHGLLAPTNQNAKDANKLCFIFDLSGGPTHSSNILMSMPSRFQCGSGGRCKARWGACTSELEVAYVFCRGKSFPL